jgi:hypothetical protein
MKRMRIGDLPRDMREELFGLHATGVNPRATQRGFEARTVPLREIDIARIDVSGYPAAQTRSYDPLNLPPVVIADGKLIDGGHRVAEAQRRGMSTVRAIDVTGLIDPNATGFVAALGRTLRRFTMKRRRQLADSCPVVKFETRQPPKGSGIRGAAIAAIVNGESVGQAIVVYGEGVPYVSDIRVAAEMKRCGVGTKLYEQAAQFACKTFKEPLHSDVERSAMSQGFWQKQVKKGRASCVSDMRAVDEDEVPDWMATAGRDGCVRYRLTCPAPKDLSRRRRRR